MRVLPFPAVAQLGNGLISTVRDEDRIEAEPLGAAGLESDPPLERAGAAELFTGRRHEHELADVARASLLQATELTEEPTDRIGTARSSRMDAGTTVESVHLDARVLSDRPLVPLRLRAAEQSLAPRVLIVGLAVFGRKVLCRERLDRPVRQQVLELTRLARIAGREARVQSVHRTSTTSSSSASCETSAGG